MPMNQKTKRALTWGVAGVLAVGGGYELYKIVKGGTVNPAQNPPTPSTTSLQITSVTLSAQ